MELTALSPETSGLSSNMDRRVGIDGGVVAAAAWMEELGAEVLVTWPLAEARAGAWPAVVGWVLVLVAWEGLLAGVVLSVIRRRRRGEAENDDLKAVLDAVPAAVEVRLQRGDVLVRNRFSRSWLGSASLDPGALPRGAHLHVGGRTLLVDRAEVALTATGRGSAEVVVAADVTAEAKAQASLQALSDTLEARLADGLRQARSAVVAKDAFLAQMTHELRTPLAGVLGLLAMVQDEELPDAVARTLHLATRTAEALRDQINGVLDYSRLESGRVALDVRPFDLDDILDELATIETGRDRPHVQLVVHVDSSVPRRLVGDPGRLRHILTNLVGNALKFTAEGLVLVSFGAVEVGEGALELTLQVDDTGVGFSPDRADALFEPSEQADGTVQAEFGGTGLGLAITRKMVEAMGG